MDSKRFKILMLAKDVLVVLMFVVSIWMLVTSVKNEREAYRILKEADDIFERTRKLDSLVDVRLQLSDSVVLPHIEGKDDIGEIAVDKEMHFIYTLYR